MAYGLWFMVYGLRFMVYGLWFCCVGFGVQGLEFDRRVRVREDRTARLLLRPLLLLAYLLPRGAIVIFVY